MARSKVNKKLALVVGGFSAAAVLLLVAIVLVNNLWIKNAERNVRAGDALMAEGKFRQAFDMYGRALSKKPDQVAYVEKMEKALRSVVAATPTQAMEDYRTLSNLNRARTRAQPLDPAQWRILLDAVEDEGDIYARGEGWLQLEGVAKDMREIMQPGTPGGQMAEETMLYARAQRESLLTSTERSDLERQAEAFLRTSPGSWRTWNALASLRIADVVRLRGSGQEQASQRRREQADKSIADMRAALPKDDAGAAVAMAQVDLDRVMLDAREGSRFDPSKIDPSRLQGAVDALVAAVDKAGRGLWARAAATQLMSARQAKAAREVLDARLAKDPDDMITAQLALELANATGGSGGGADEATRTAAKRILDRPQLPTGLSSFVQAESRSRALQVLLDAAIIASSAPDIAPTRKAELDREIADSRAKLLEAQQNDAASPVILSTDAKIAQSKGDLTGASRMWESYFAKVPQPAADAFLWACLVSRAQNDLGLAMQYASRGSDAHPTDARLVIQRAELAVQLGRVAEAAALFEGLAKSFPDRQEFVRMAADLKSRAEGTQAQAAPEVEAIEAAVNDNDLPRARELAAAWAASSGGTLPAVFAQVMVEERAGDKAKALELVREALNRFPTNPDLARTEAFFATEDPVERIDLMTARLVPDPKRRPLERLRALRSIRVELARQIETLKRGGASDVTASERALARVEAELPAAEKAAAELGGDDQGAIELTFNDALARKDWAAAEVQVQAAAKVAAASPSLEPVLRARLLDAQGRAPEAIAALEAARKAGRTEAPVAAMLAMIQERVGNEPAAFALWKEAYERRPNDPNIVRGYTRALGRGGQGRQALDLLRAAVAASPSDTDLANVAAEFESVYGLRSRAVELRQRIVQVDPSNRQNLLELYTLLFMPPDFGSVRDASGRSRFDARTWATVPPEEQQRLLDDARRANLELAERLYQAALQQAPYDVQLAIRKSTALREVGKCDLGTAALRSMIDAATAAGKATYTMHAALAAHLAECGDQAGCDAAFAKAKELQDPSRREVDAILVEFAAGRGEYAKAVQVMKEAFGAQPTLPNVMRLADLQLLARQYPDAEASVAKAREMLAGKADGETQRALEMLAAGVLAGRADELRDQGKLDESKAKAEEALAAVGRAEVASPVDLTAPLRRAQLLRAMAIGSNEPKRLDEAVAEADRILARNALYWPAVTFRADLALDKRDPSGAVGILERYLQAQPGNEEASTKLMDLLVATGNVPRAAEVVRAAVSLRPDDPRWAERLGDLLDGSGDRAGAAREYERAFTLDPKTVRYAEKATYALLKSGKANDALAVMRNAADLVQRSPMLRGIAASALMQSGRRDEALVAARDAILAARATPDEPAAPGAAPAREVAIERTMVTLREMYGDQGAQDLEALVLSVGDPTPIESAMIADAWARMGSAGSAKGLEWCAKVDAMGDKASPGVKAGIDLTRGTLLYAKGDAVAACDAFERAAKLSGRNASALNNAAYLLSTVKKDHRQALEYASRAVQLAPSQPDYLDTLGYVFIQLGRMDDAVDALEKSVAVQPTSTALIHLGQARAGQGKFAEARRAAQQAKDLGAIPPDAQKELDALNASLEGK
jgi:tetratricopeptide (TPR) repeat protein